MTQVAAVFFLVAAQLAPGGDVQHTGSVNLGTELPVALFVRPDEALVIVTNLTVDGPCRVRLAKPDGAVVMTRDYEGLAILARYQDGPLAIPMRSAEDWSVIHYRVIDASTGGIIDTVKMPLSSNATISAAGDAVAVFSDPDHEWSPRLTMRALRSNVDEVRQHDENIGMVAIASGNLSFIGYGSGRIAAFAGDARRWSIVGAGDYTYTGMETTPDGKTLMVRQQLGRFRVYDGESGAELFRYDESDPRSTLEPIGLLNRAETALSGRPAEQALTLAQVIARAKARLTRAGRVLVVDETDVLGGVVELDPRARRVVGATATMPFWNAMSAAGFPNDAVVRTAIRGAAVYQLSWFDAHLWAYAECLGLPEIYSEDFQHGRLYGTVRAVNPFR